MQFFNLVLNFSNYEEEKVKVVWKKIVIKMEKKIMEDMRKDIVNVITPVSMNLQLKIYFVKIFVFGVQFWENVQQNQNQELSVLLCVDNLDTVFELF